MWVHYCDDGDDGDDGDDASGDPEYEAIGRLAGQRVYVEQTPGNVPAGDDPLRD